MNVTSALLFLAVTATVARAQAVESWQTRVDHSPHGEYVYDGQIAPDGTTTYFGVEQVQPGEMNAAGGSVVRLDPLGNVVWSRRYDVFTPGPNHTRFYAGALDSNGGCAAAGQAIELRLPSSTRNLHVVRYDAAGTQLWSSVVPNALPQSIKIARDGDVWVAGTKVATNGYDDVGVWRFSASGVLLSTTIWDGPGHRSDRPADIATDGAGGLYVCGLANGGPSFPPTNSRLVMRLGPAGDVLWSIVDGMAPARSTELVVEPGGNIYVASAVSEYHVGVVAKHAPSGTRLWERNVSGVSGVYREPHIALAPGGDVVGVSGAIVLAARFDPAGAQRWSTLVSTGNFECATGIAVDSQGSVTVALTREPGGANPTMASAVRLDANGTIRWHRPLTGGFEWATAIAVGAGPPGSAFVLGPVRNTVSDWGFVARLDEQLVSYCAGDRTGTSCPCGNVGQSGRGCPNTVAPAGALLSASGAPSIANDTLRFTGSGMPNSTVLYFQGTTTAALGAGSVFGDGLMCVAGSIARIGMRTNVGGSSSYPGPSDPSVSTRGGIAGGMQSRTYQAWYRDPADFCTIDTFNLTNALIVIWIP